MASSSMQDSSLPLCAKSSSPGPECSYPWARSNIRVLDRTEVVAAHGDDSLEAIDVRNAATGETTRLESGGLFMFIGADAETAWLPPEIALDRHGYVLTGSDVTVAEGWEPGRDPYLLETSVPGIFACGDVRFGPVKRPGNSDCDNR